ncbi:Pyruvate/Phosphoenolpyruvate kinase-like domain-containing protein [Baffinella frigidus]|nr:Pyruvate/Phosphoenolpyruvate kinase-like domain-containing protein [Cryptophyta sp. CCMP2293]
MDSNSTSYHTRFTITTQTCADYNAGGKKLPDGVWEDTLSSLKKIEKQMDMQFGNPARPLLVSVRSGAAKSMPGMMDTKRGVAEDSELTSSLTTKPHTLHSKPETLNLKSRINLVPLAMKDLKEERGVVEDSELTSSDLKLLCETYKGLYKNAGKEFPQDPTQQLRLAIDAVFNSWDSDRAVTYRNIHHITDMLGTAVTVQSMVFGNLGQTSGTGVLFSRDPCTGEKGEDVVSGIRTPNPIAVLQQEMPQAYEELLDNVTKLELHYKDLQDIEFTIQDGKLFMLQCRSGKRTGPAAVRIAVDMHGEGVLTKDEAIMMVEGGHLDQLLHQQFQSDTHYQGTVIGKGLPASPGAAVGQIVFTPADAMACKAQGGVVILVRCETSPEDVGGMHAAEGIVTQRGGMTSHAAVVARGWGKTCVCGCAELLVDDVNKQFTIGGKVFKTGDWISVNGNTGQIIEGKEPLVPPRISGDLGTFMTWVDERRKLKVFTNADTPEDAAEARRNGAEGIGLVRTEHMFFATDERLKAVRQMIMAEDPKARKVALEKLLPFQRSDFEGIFNSMDGMHVTIRLLDPPLHEFLPNAEQHDVCQSMADDLGVSLSQVLAKIHSLEEVNPMLGLRGCRLGIVHPEISEMQARAIFEAALNVQEWGGNPKPDIMVKREPLTPKPYTSGTVKEFEHQEALVRRVARQVFEERGDTVEYRVGTMIEIPRAALLAADIAKVAEFFSFGTNDLTQMTFGYSRDDAGSFLPIYTAQGILPEDPFQVLDRKGVGLLIKMAVESGRKANPTLDIGICGEHGGEPSSIEFVAGVGLDYVSCSPYRVPIARLAAAQVFPRKVYIRLPGKGNSTSNGARPVN